MALGVVAVLAIGTFAVTRSSGDGAAPSPPEGRSDRLFESTDPVERGCALGEDLLLPLANGHDPAHSEDVTIVPNAPNYSGTFTITSHSGPWNYLQNVPLVLYGPGHIAPAGDIVGHAEVADVYPTIGELTGVQLPARRGKVLNDALDLERPSPPKLVLVIVWDGAGRNVLERWPDAWPTLARLEREGTSYQDAVVGSSPSITPAIHSTLGTGAYPVDHGVTAIEYRTKEGNVRNAFADRDPRDLRLTTFADEIDRALDNEPIVGTLAWKSWHIGMMGHGAATPDGDHDQLAIIGSDETISGNDAFYETPEGLDVLPNLQEHADDLDRTDGAADGMWMGHEILELHDNPAWVEAETDALIQMIDLGGYGDDDVTDFLFTNFKMTDIVGHQYTMDSKEMEIVLRAQDDSLARIVAHLEKAVGEFVIVLTADHGHTPDPDSSGAWPILQGQLAEDVDAYFDVPFGETLITTTSAAGPFLNDSVMRELRIEASDVAKFLNGYTIRDNWNADELPEAFADRGDEPVLAAAFASDQYDEVLECAGIRPLSPLP